MAIIKEIYQNLTPRCRFLLFNKARGIWLEVRAFLSILISVVPYGNLTHLTFFIILFGMDGTSDITYKRSRQDCEYIVVFSCLSAFLYHLDLSLLLHVTSLQ